MTRVVGIDIGHDTIRAAELENPNSARPRLLRTAEVALTEGAVREGEVREVNTVASALRRLWSAGGFRTKNVVLGMGNQRVLAREFSLPKLARRSQIRDALPFQVQDLLPVPVGDVILDFYPVSESEGENGPVLNGLLIAAIKDAVMANVTATSRAGLEPISVDLIPFALARLLGPGEPHGNVAIVEIGADTTSVLILSEGTPVFVRIVAAGGDDLSRSLQANFELSAEQAEHVKRTYGLNVPSAPPEQRLFVENCFTVASELTRSIHNTIAYFQSSRHGVPVDRVLLSGGGSLIPGLGAALAEQTRLNVIPARPYERLQIAKGALPADPSRAPQFAVAIGLAVGSAA
jgi:type IV pilus assembly protein PilM